MDAQALRAVRSPERRPGAAATLFAVVAAAATDLVAWAMLGPDAEVVPGDIATSVARIALVVAFGGIVAAGIGLVLRSTTGTLTAMFLLILALPVALGNTGVAWLITSATIFPGRAIVSVVVVDEVELSAGKITVVIVAWAAAAYVSLTRRDTV